MTDKEIYCMGRAEYLAEFEGYSLSEGYKIAEGEFEESKKVSKENNNGISKKSQNN